MEIGRSLAKTLLPGAIVCFFGDLGAGKTTLIKGIVSELAQIAPEEITSPTFSYLQLYEGIGPVYHFDLYRLCSVEEFLGLGFEEQLFSTGIVLIEWSERIESLVPDYALRITLHHKAPEHRIICFSKAYEISTH